MLGIVRILAIIFGVIALLIGIGIAVALEDVYNACVSSGLPDCGAGGGFEGLGAGLIIFAALINFIIFVAAGRIRDQVDAGDYDGAKFNLLVWTILGFLLAGILTGIFLLVAYLKMDPLINWQRNSETVAPVTSDGVPRSSLDRLPLPPPPVDTPTCSECGRPTTFIAQYGRDYCFADRLYAPTK